MLKIIFVIVFASMIVFSTDSLNELERNEENSISLNQQESKNEFINIQEAEKIEEIYAENDKQEEIVNNEQLDKKQEEVKTSKNVIAVPKQAANTPKEEKKNVTNENKNKDTSNKSNNSANEQNNTNEPVIKEEEKNINSNNSNKENNSYKEYEVTVAKKTKCDGNNHKIIAGNTGKWFDSQAQAESYYNQEIEIWGKKWENENITKEEYLKICPSGYETWSCPQCQKWTLNFYYR